MVKCKKNMPLTCLISLKLQSAENSIAVQPYNEKNHVKKELLTFLLRNKRTTGARVGNRGGGTKGAHRILSWEESEKISIEKFAKFCHPHPQKAIKRGLGREEEKRRKNM